MSPKWRKPLWQGICDVLMQGRKRVGRFLEKDKYADVPVRKSQQVNKSTSQQKGFASRQECKVCVFFMYNICIYIYIIYIL